LNSKRFDLYGWRAMPLPQACALIARALGVEFELHESGYRGGDYYRSARHERPEVIVQPNFEDDEGYLSEGRFADYETLVYINGSNDEVATTLASIEGLDFLRSQVI